MDLQKGLAKTAPPAKALENQNYLAAIMKHNTLERHPNSLGNLWASTEILLVLSWALVMLLHLSVFIFHSQVLACNICNALLLNK